MKKNPIVLADLDEMIFEGRNQNYGGYVIRKEHNLYLGSALGIVSAIMVILAAFFFLNRNPQQGPGQDLSGIITTIDIDLGEFELPEVEEPKIDEPIVEEPAESDPLPKEEPMQGTTETDFRNLKASADAADSNTVVEADSIIGNPSDRDMAGNDSTGVAGNPADKKGKNPVNPNKEKKDTGGDGTGDPDINKVFLDLEETPSPMNMDLLKKEMGYPSLAREMGLEGQVIFRILVDENGNYKKHKAIYSSHKVFTNHVEPYLSKLKFSPGVQAGHNVRVWVNIPFKFAFLK